MKLKVWSYRDIASGL